MRIFLERGQKPDISVASSGIDVVKMDEKRNEGSNEDQHREKVGDRFYDSSIKPGGPDDLYGVSDYED